MRRALLSLLLVAALGSAARADIIHFANGRTIEGRVVERGLTDLTIEIPGGRLVVPIEQVARVEARRAPQDDLADKTRKTDMGDPDAVTRLAEWAASRGLGEEARQLEEHADGVRLERQVEVARAKGTASAWLDVLAWAEGRGHGRVVLAWLAARALEADPQDPEAVLAGERIARLDDVPSPAPAPLPPPPTPRRAPPPPPRTGSESAADRERIAQLEAELAAQDAEADELRNRVNRLENQRRGVRRRRPPTNPPIQPGLFLVPAPQPPAPPPPPAR